MSVIESKPHRSESRRKLFMFVFKNNLLCSLFFFFFFFLLLLFACMGRRDLTFLNWTLDKNFLVSRYNVFNNDFRFLPLILNAVFNKADTHPGSKLSIIITPIPRKQCKQPISRHSSALSLFRVAIFFCFFFPSLRLTSFPCIFLSLLEFGNPIRSDQNQSCSHPRCSSLMRRDIRLFVTVNYRSVVEQIVFNIFVMRSGRNDLVI